MRESPPPKKNSVGVRNLRSLAKTVHCGDEKRFVSFVWGFPILPDCKYAGFAVLNPHKTQKKRLSFLHTREINIISFCFPLQWENWGPKFLLDRGKEVGLGQNQVLLLGVGIMPVERWRRKLWVGSELVLSVSVEDGTGGSCFIRIWIIWIRRWFKVLSDSYLHNSNLPA